CSGRRSSRWPAWSRSPAGCTLPTGAAPTWRARRSPTASSRPSARTVRRILRDVDLQPHRTRYWRTGRPDEQFKDRAEKVLWCYANAGPLACEGIWTVAVDEMPNLQVLERRPIRRAIPGCVEHQEFEYVRHGTV